MNRAPLKNLNRNTFTTTQIKALQEHYSKINGIDPNSKSYKALIQLLDSLPKETLKNLSESKIKFISSLARNRI